MRLVRIFEFSRLLRVPAAVFALALIQACNPTQTLDAPTQAATTFTLHLVDPQDTDPAIQTFLDPHWAYAPAQPNGFLLVMLPGSGGTPDRMSEFLQFAAETGLHALGLNYPNRPSVARRCRGQTSDCYEGVRLETITGIDHSGQIEVAEYDSIEHRLLQALIFLHDHFPTEGWEQFFSESGPHWSALMVGGVSQGGGHAAIIGKQHAVARVLMFSSPGDFSRDNGEIGPVPYMTGAGATPPGNYYGFTHTEEAGFSKHLANWKALGLLAFGQPVSVDQFEPPYRGAHILTTSVLPATGSFDNAHGSMLANALLGRDEQDVPLVLVAWQQLLLLDE